MRIGEEGKNKSMSWWIINEPLSIERLSIAIAGLPASLVGVKLVQLSDLHYDGLRLGDELLSEAIEASNRENPDLVLLTGDYVTDDPTPIFKLASKLKSLKSRAGIYACLGNHDIRYLHSQKTITQAFLTQGINVLWNAIATPLGDEFPIVGLADYWSPDFDPASVLNSLDPDTPRLVLSHNPDTAEILRSWRVDLQLSGHTHGGQIFIPGFGSGPLLLQKLRQSAPPLLQPYIPFLKQCARVVQHWQWAQGWHQVGRNQLYVNRGLGTYFPGRLFCPPEVTAIVLDSGK
jgi:uncharacterized protein